MSKDKAGSLNKQKKNNLAFMLLVIFLIAVIMCVSSFGLATYARYRTATGGNVTAEIAKWNFKVNGQSEEFAEIDLAKTISFEHVVDTTIAPGTSGAFDLVIDGTGSEVSFDYYVDISVQSKPTNMKFYTDSSHDSSKELQIVNNKIQLEDEILLTDKPMTKTETIYWDWAYKTEKYPSQEVINKYVTEQPIQGLQTLINEYNADETTDSRKAELILKINDKIDTHEAGGHVILPIKVTGIQKYPGGLVAKGVSITSSTTKEYNLDDTLTFALEFTEGVYADVSKSIITRENAPEIMIEFEDLDVAQNPVAKVASLLDTQIKIATGTIRKAEFVGVDKNKINYEYTIKRGDRGIVKIASVTGSVYSKSGNKIELTQNNMPSITGETITSIAKEKLNIQVGDTVYYTPSGEYILNQEYATSNSSGEIVLNSETADFKIEKWHVLNVSEDEIDIVPYSTTKGEINLQGANGYNNGVKILNEACSSLYSNSKKGIVARSINIEDFEKKLDEANIVYNGKTWRQVRDEYGSSPKYGKQYRNPFTANKSWYPLMYESENNSVINGEIKSDGINVSDYDKDNYIIGSKQADESIQPFVSVYELVLSNYLDDVNCKILNRGMNGYWIASRCVSCDDLCARFYLFRYYNKIDYSSDLYNSKGNESVTSTPIFPVVTVKNKLLEAKEDGSGFEVK